MFMHQHVHSRRDRIVLHFSKPLSLSSSHGYLPLRDSDQHAIGCNKRSCLCCALWIYSYNAKFGTGWLTSGSHGKPYATWALPGNAATLGAGVDEFVVNGVQTRLADTLSWMYPGSRRVSDEHVSSEEESLSPESSGDEKAERVDIAIEFLPPARE